MSTDAHHHMHAQGRGWLYIGTMPRKSKLELAPVGFGSETLGQRLARIRKERGFTQSAIAERTGLTQDMVWDYERASTPAQQPSLKLMRHMERIESPPLYRQRALLTTSDQFLAAADR